MTDCNTQAYADVGDLLDIEAHRAQALDDVRAVHGRSPDAATLAHLAALYQRRAIIMRTAAVFGGLTARDVDTRDMPESAMRCNALACRRASNHQPA